MKRKARVWIKGALEHDEEFYFEDFIDLYIKLEDVQSKWGLGLYKLLLHGDLQKRQQFTLPEGVVELDMIRVTAEGEEILLPAMFPRL